MSKYPWIPREYYAATMFACKMIRENGYFNKAIDIASSYYGVDYDTLEGHVRARQAAGQRGRRAPNTGKKLKWWYIPTLENAPHESCWEVMPTVKRGYSPKSIFRTLVREDNAPLWSEYYKSYGDAVGPFDTKDEAERAASKYAKERGILEEA